MVKVVPAHPIVSGILVCNVADGRAFEPNKPDPWTFCPYCGLRLMDGLMVGVASDTEAGVKRDG